MKEIFELLKKEHHVSDDLINFYDKYVDNWSNWWVGHDKDFHDYKQKGADDKLHDFTRSKLYLAKKVSEDWASLLLNDKTRIVLKDKSAQKFLTGDAEEQNGGVLEANDFWVQANKLVEHESAKGTTGYVLSLENAELMGDGNLQGGDIKIRYIKDPRKIIPLSYDNSEITECAFVSEKIVNNKKYIYLERHLLNDDGTYTIKNEYYEKEDNKLIKVTLYDDVVEEFISDTKLFFISKPMIENNFNNNVPLGVSRYANAIDILKACDLAFDNLVNDFLLGGKKLFVDESLIETNEQGKPLPTGTIEKRLMYKKSSSTSPNKPNTLIDEYNPKLRVEENKQGIQFFLDLLSSNVGLGQHRYAFEQMSIATATQVKASNKDLIDSVYKQRIGIIKLLTDLTRSILKLGKSQLGQNYDENTEIAIMFDETMFNDEEADKRQLMQEIKDGISQPYEYRMKYKNEEENKAKAMTAKPTFKFDIED